MAIVLIGIDDTDNDTSPGTGRLARRLVEEATRRGVISLGITRHQLLVDDRIPYTRQNRGVCVAVEWNGSLEMLNFTADLVAEWSAPGSDPGICIAIAEPVGPEVIAWGSAATRQVLGMEEAMTIADACGMRLRSLGGTGQGIIGALACVGLRAGGNDGRFVDMPGLRQLEEYVSERELSLMGIRIEHQPPAAVAIDEQRGGRNGSNGMQYKTLGWVRPRLIQGKAVWPVEWSEEHHAWISIDRKKSRSLE